MPFVKNQALKNEIILEGLLDSPDAPLEQAYSYTNLVANTREGRESNWAAKIQHLISNAKAQSSTAIPRMLFVNYTICGSKRAGDEANQSKLQMPASDTRGWPFRRFLLSIGP